MNKIKQNFEVVDGILGDYKTGKIISDATGRPGRLWDKIQELFDIIVEKNGQVRPQNSSKFKTMLRRLQENIDPYITYEKYIKRAKLLVPDHEVLPLKAMIESLVKNEEIRDLMISAVISEL